MPTLSRRRFLGLSASSAGVLLGLPVGFTLLRNRVNGVEEAAAGRGELVAWDSRSKTDVVIDRDATLRLELESPLGGACRSTRATLRRARWS